MTRHRRLTAKQGALLVVDIQEKLLAVMSNGPRLVANSRRLVLGAELLNVPVLATEQYPAGLGETVPELRDLLPHRPSKVTFSCCVLPELIEQLHGRGIRHVTLAGIETHVCVSQTALDLLGMGFDVQIPADAVSSRHEIDWSFALKRLEAAGAIISTTEAVLFEWLESADHPSFKAISTLVKSTPG